MEELSEVENIGFAKGLMQSQEKARHKKL